MTHILYNPQSGSNSGKGYAMMLEICYPDSASHDVTQIDGETILNVTSYTARASR